MSAPAKAKGRVRKTMIVAMARKLMSALWKYLTLGVVREGAVVLIENEFRRDGRWRRKGMGVDRSPQGI
jgi:hypothetical protein